jgi:hypothetical protein
MKDSKRAVLGIFIICEVLAVCLVADGRVAQERYSTYRNARFSYVISYPTGLLNPQGESDNGDGQKFLSRDGQVEMIVYGSQNASDQSLQDVYKSQLPREGNNRLKSQLTYKILSGNWFVVSGYQGERVYYQKTILSGGVFKTFRIEYDKSRADVFDKVTKKVAASFRG